jgi:c(7)-type cytochrome triheme protein
MPNFPPKGETEMKYKNALPALLLLSIFISLNALAVPAGQTITWGGGGQGTVKFKGSEHAEKGYKCDACHPSLFQNKYGSAKMTMTALNNGQFCGACHNGKTAFGTNEPRKCHKCHKMPKKHDKDKHHE